MTRPATKPTQTPYAENTLKEFLEKIGPAEVEEAVRLINQVGRPRGDYTGAEEARRWRNPDKTIADTSAVYKWCAEELWIPEARSMIDDYQ